MADEYGQSSESMTNSLKRIPGRPFYLKKKRKEKQDHEHGHPLEAVNKLPSELIYPSPAQ